MLINNGRILKNGDYIFKAPAIDSYVTNNNPSTNILRIGVSGTSIYNPLNVYYKTLTEVKKWTRTTDSTNWQVSIPATSETSNKPFYFTGNLDGVYRLEFSSSNAYDYKGDLQGLLDEFTLLQNFDMLSDSNFSQDLSGLSFPRTLKEFHLRDNSVNGDVATWKNADNLEILELYDGNYTGNLDELGLTKLTKLQLDNLFSINGDVKEIQNNNPNLAIWDVWNCSQMTGDVTEMDVSSWTYVDWYAAGNTNIVGNMSGWTFNTGMTYFQIYLREFGGDISDWDISDTKITRFSLNNFNYNQNHVTGDTSAWVLPSTLTSFTLYGIDFSKVPHDFTTSTNLTSIQIQYCYNLTDDINDIDFTGLGSSLTILKTGMVGNLETFVTPTGVTNLQLRGSNFTGNLSGITINTGLTSLYFDDNDLHGDLTEFQPFNDALTRLEVDGNTGLTLNLDAGTFNTNNLNYLYLTYFSGITGSWSNFYIPTSMYSLYLDQVGIVTGDISDLDQSKITGILRMNNSDLFGDITDWFSGTSVMTQFNCGGNTELSGDTSNWNVDTITDLRIDNSALDGTLVHNSVSLMQIGDTNINSNIETDLDFSTRLYYFTANYSDIIGNLSGITLYSNFYYFSVTGCESLSGTNEFINYLYVNREVWTRSNCQAHFSSIGGDTASGTTENLGDLGTYGGETMDLTEAQVNNLTNGLDYTGSGTNVSWNSKQKVYWMKNAEISSTNTTKRYDLRTINYS